ncbi:methyltransferase [Conchiformibius kuhniae]|uniref:Methyltransferase n=1 Tax=Conchiformibius kuhniae TaxID=211502 RepID=A0A8T9MZC5_9NEIS|nr:class I SAM-dependent methyltransferase [Conchiformibius kuhniae]UOP05143.1 class I SAM-dependent methyltransferase [Conchiformibius kuhniae]
MPLHTITLADGRSLAYRSENRHRPPQRAVPARQISAAQVFRHACNGTATLWTGDFHQGKQLLAALKKHARKPAAPAPDPQTAFHKHRLAQSQHSRTANMLLVIIGAGFTLDLPRAPDVSAALADVYGTPNREPFLLPLKQLLGFIGAHQWHLKGVDVPALDGRIHVPFGVFSPVRGEYVGLLRDAPLPPVCETAFDIGTGSGVLAVLLAQRGFRRVVATDCDARAAACARANVRRFGLHAKIDVLQQNLFPAGTADLIVCNPPWLPAKPTSAIESALYDPDHAMLRAFLRDAPACLNPQGQIWLVLSDLAEHLSLRPADALPQWFAQAGLRLLAADHVRPIHGKAADPSDPLAFARQRERTFLYRLAAAQG